MGIGEEENQDEVPKATERMKRRDTLHVVHGVTVDSGYKFPDRKRPEASSSRPGRPTADED